MEDKYLVIKNKYEIQHQEYCLKSINWEYLAQEYCKKDQLKLAKKKAYYQTQPTGIPQLPPNLILRDYQEEAVINWFKNKGRGTLKMATGSGKTITALAIVTELYEQIDLDVLLVICPFRHLVIQWKNSISICYRPKMERIFRKDKRQTFRCDGEYCRYECSTSKHAIHCNLSKAATRDLCQIRF